MSYYRDLNKELIGQVQTMRINLKLYLDEIVNLKGELMQKYETEVVLRKECYTWALESFIQLIQTVQPDSDILPVLKEYYQPQERISNATSSSHTSRTRRTPTSGERLSGLTRIHSSQLTAEFQRSNSILNTRKSVCSTSPIRRSSNEAVEEDPAEIEVESAYEEQEPQGEEEDCENVTESVAKQTELSQEQPEENLNIIYEDSEKDAEEEDEHYDVENAETVDESVEEVTADISVSKTRTTLKDVTNMLADTTNSSHKDKSSIKVVSKRGRRKKGKTTTRIFQEDSTDDLENDSDTEHSIPLHHTRLADKSDTLQEPRRHTNARRALMRNKSIPITQASCNHTCEEVTLASPTSAYTDMTLGNFKDAACSTPKSPHNSLRKPTTSPTFTTTTTNLLSETESVTINSVTSRPSRQCKPKDLSEAKLQTKLRNESVFKSKKKKKSTSITRTKNKT